MSVAGTQWVWAGVPDETQWGLTSRALGPVEECALHLDRQAGALRDLWVAVA